MTRWFLSFLMFLLIPAISICQRPVLEIQNSGSALFLTHDVAPKESFYSIGRMYNVSPRDLASFNHLSMEKGLNIGQHLKVPLDKNNFTQSTSKSAAEALVPLYHTVVQDETLYRIGVHFRNVPLNSLKKWNHLQSDNVNTGAALIVGYLRVSKTESALAKTKFEIPGSNQTAVTTTTSKPTPVVKEVVQETVKETPKREPQTEPTPRPKEEPKVEPKDQIQPQVPLVVDPTNGEKVKEGFFKKDFIDQANGGNIGSSVVATSVFKSTSGWQDEKYYCFNNDATPGSILKISIPSTGKSVYAKVLDAIPDIKQNEGVQLVLSNAAVSALGITDEKFESTISYVK